MTKKLILLTGDRSLETSYRDNTFVGYLTALPTTLLAPPLARFLYPPPRPGPAGSLPRVHLSLRTLEAILARDPGLGARTRLVHPAHLVTHAPLAGVVCLSTMDPRGLGPATSSWQVLRAGRPFHVREFVRLVERIARLKRQHHFKMVVGGAGAWQLADRRVMDAWGIDHVFLGEAEDAFLPWMREVLVGTAPRITRASPADLTHCPVLKGPTILNMQEVTRGCGRMCQFCAPTTSGRMRHVPLETIAATSRVFASHGARSVCLQSEDTLRYGSRDFSIDLDALLGLYRAIFGTGIKRAFLTHVSLASVVAQPDDFAKFSQFLHHHGHKYYGAQPGIETGSTRLIRRTMAGKLRPTRDMSWPGVVKAAMKSFAEQRWIPTCSVILGFPDETEEDRVETETLLDYLIARRYHCVFAPLLFVPVPETPLGRNPSPSFKTMLPRHVRMFKKMWRHNLRGNLIRAWNVYNIREYAFPRWKRRLLEIGTRVVARLL